MGGSPGWPRGVPLRWDGGRLGVNQGILEGIGLMPKAGAHARRDGVDLVGLFAQVSDFGQAGLELSLGRRGGSLKMF